MSLVVAVMDGLATGSLRGTASWGERQLQPLSDPTILATDHAVRSETTSHLLVLVPQEHAKAAHVTAATVAAARPDLPVRVEPVPVSAAVLMRAVELVPEQATTATAVFDAITTSLRTSLWGAWLPSVAKLSSPAPSVRQHVQSWFADRKTGFLAVHGEEGWVAKLPYAEVAPERRLNRVPAPGTVASAYECHAFGELPEPAIATLFAMGLSTRPVRRDLVADPTEHWGTSKAVEFVISWPTPLRSSAPATHLCPACQSPLWTETCPFCRIAGDLAGRYHRTVQQAPTSEHAGQPEPAEQTLPRPPHSTVQEVTR
jgi:hypothetical protein